ncbi:BamA/TamA family outer membrane protein [Acetobacteraceae bacterium KSS8]|uniref:BamA/TamA family outer membrane protein n=1 Tax=Endosaccharibacter trunci TaxID=2812733 RepID=A0ABT1WC81_9PROT|nr:BamA/TamA family outer membrane protein [Acetobacteraceae bacterium KSS8]
MIETRCRHGSPSASGRFVRRALRCGAVAGLIVAGASVAGLPFGQEARAADPVAYQTVLVPTGNGAVDAALRASSALITLQKTRAVSPFALAGRARGDEATLRTALESFGFYAGHITITVAGKSADDPSLPNVLAAWPSGKPVPIRISAERGPMFHLGAVSLALGKGEQLTPAEQAAFGLKSGQDAVAADVLAAGGRLQTALQEDGHAFASVKPPVAILHPDSRTLDIRYQATEGPRLDIGQISLDGLKHVNASYVRKLLLVHPGELYQPSKIEAARQDLASTGVFSNVAVTAATAPAPNGTLPLTFDFTEALRHTVALQAGYSTDLGGSAGVSWTHRNLFGNGEKLSLAALVTGLGGTAQNGLGYDVYADLLRPFFLRRDQSLDLRVEGLKQNLQAYDQTALLVRGLVNRKINKQWTVSGGLGAEQERIRQEGVSRSYTLAFVPLTANFDNTGLANPLDDPTHGFRISLGATPSYSFGSGDGNDGSTNTGANTFFTILQATASTYFDLNRIGLTKPGRSVIAVRAIVGSVQGADTFDLPPDQRLYAGGSGTVRGFKYQGIGPQFADGNPVGGTSLDAGTVEFRQRIGKSFGFAAFADAGQVGTGSAPFAGTLRVGAGIGARYYTAIGPIRLDVAVPLNKPQGGDSFELYVGLGEAF